MNRLHPAVESELEENCQIEFGRYRIVDDETPHSLFIPLHYEQGYAYPLVVWMHSGSDNEHQLRKIMPLVSLRNYAAVAPRGTSRSSDSLPAYEWSQTEPEIEVAADRVDAAIAAATERVNIHTDRIFIAGYADGGTMAFRMAACYPERFAGAISLGGAFPRGYRPLRSLASLRQLPLFLATARDSVRYTQERVCDDLRLFHTAGLSVNLRQYPCGDEVTTLMLEDMNRWMMEIVCPDSTCQQSAEVPHPDTERK